MAQTDIVAVTHSRAMITMNDITNHDYDVECHTKGEYYLLYICFCLQFTVLYFLQFFPFYESITFKRFSHTAYENIHFTHTYITPSPLFKIIYFKNIYFKIMLTLNMVFYNMYE